MESVLTLEVHRSTTHPGMCKVIARRNGKGEVIGFKDCQDRDDEDRIVCFTDLAHLAVFLDASQVTLAYLLGGIPWSDAQIAEAVRQFNRPTCWQELNLVHHVHSFDRVLVPGGVKS